VLGPGRRPRLTPSPAIAAKPGEWVMPIGSPGNDVQPQAMLQVFLNIHLWGMTPQAAVEAPRFASFSFPRSSAPHAYDPGLLKLEARIGADVGRALAGLGHDVRDWPEWDYAAGAVCTILADQRTGMMEGGADPRRPTAVVGW
jgi:gamma-glutamyltranspeptidase/glutathione hydrolase